jgi:hypothetical protein
MGTRSTYRVIERGVHEGKKWENKLVLVYLQFDGYPSGHPSTTAEWLASGTVVNGLSGDQKGLLFNGAKCLAARLVAELKDGPGGTYIYPLQHRGKSGEDYTYDIIVEYAGKDENDRDKYSITFIAYDVSGGWGNKPLRFKKLYSGTPEGFKTYVESLK